MSYLSHIYHKYFAEIRSVQQTLRAHVFCVSYRLLREYRTLFWSWWPSDLRRNKSSTILLEWTQTTVLINFACLIAAGIHSLLTSSARPSANSKSRASNSAIEVILELRAASLRLLTWIQLQARNFVPVQLRLRVSFMFTSLKPPLTIRPKIEAQQAAVAALHLVALIPAFSLVHYF